MLLIWTKSSMPLSKAIRWLAGEPVSHFGVVFDKSLVFHSNLYGAHLEWFDTFKKHCEIVYSMDIKGMTLEQEEAVYRSIVSRFDGYKYDFRAFFYFGWRLLMRKIFRKPLPAKNRWDNEKHLLCTEIASGFPEPFLYKADSSITTPYALFKYYKEAIPKVYGVDILE